MRHDEKTEARREQPVAVDWHDCSWSPQITVPPPPRASRRLMTKPLPAPPQILHTPRRNPSYSKTMKTILPSSRRHRAGFTLVEMLVVIAIIGILAAMLLPVLAAAKTNALKNKAKIEEQGLVTAIQGYDSDYGRFPVSTNAQNAANGVSGDFTYGTTGAANATFNQPTSDSINANNSEVVAILMDMQTYPGNGTQTLDYNHVKNPKQLKYLNATLAGDATLPGVGPDLVYRDPWGNPYVISMDLNFDGVCEDALYEQSAVSANTSLIKQPDGNYAFHGTVMVWSAGPDKAISSGGANSGANKDNVVSWQ
jgi:prepilin-type N-terminal cleavage/methylation domain-containing protein